METLEGATQIAPFFYGGGDDGRVGMDGRL